MSDYKCEACGKYKKPDNSQLQIGDEVGFSVGKQSGRTIRVSAKEGLITAIDGDCLTIHVKRGGDYVRQRAHVTQKGAPNGITLELFGVCVCPAVKAPA